MHALVQHFLQIAYNAVGIGYGITTSSQREHKMSGGGQEGRDPDASRLHIQSANLHIKSNYCCVSVAAAVAVVVATMVI